MSSQDASNRRLGLEQEFFLVNSEGVLCNRADEFLQRCHQLAQAHGRPMSCFAPEFVKSIIEINTVPVNNVAELRQEYLELLRFTLKIARELNLRLYPLATYPLYITPVMRDKLNYHLQACTVGAERFENAAKCTGTHLHLELPAGIVDRRVAVSYSSSKKDREELVDIYNLVTALDAALIALSRACPFYDGRVSGMAMRTIHYRGSHKYAWEGVYTDLQPVGGLMPYVETIEDLVEQQFYRYYTWLQAMDRAGMERQLFWESGGELLRAAWNPVRLNSLGTVELRGMDSNYPAVTLELVSLVVAAANRVRREGIRVRPKPGVNVFELAGTELSVPEFSYLNGDLLYAAVTEGVDNQAVREYLDSVAKFSGQTDSLSSSLSRLRTGSGQYRTTEAELLDQFAPTTGELSRQEGLNIVLHCCEELEHQVESLSQWVE